MASLLSWLPRCARRWKALDFSRATRYVRLPADHKIDEECLPDYVASRYYPARLGEMLRDQYQIVGKLGFGASSTVWLARDLVHRRHVALKLFIDAQSMGVHNNNELDMYQRIARVKTNHPGRTAVRQLLDSFDVSSPDGEHRCLVHPPLWDSVLTFLRRNPAEARLPAPLVAYILQRLFLALDFLHTECQIIHTDIKADNMMFGIVDDSVFHTFEQQELSNPSPRKEVDGRTIYTCRQLPNPKKHGAVVLCDFGSAVVAMYYTPKMCSPTSIEHQRLFSKSPGRMRSISGMLDAWSVKYLLTILTVIMDGYSSMHAQVWDIFQGCHLFNGYDPEHRTYRSRAHLAEMIALLGPPPSSFLQKGALRSKFFADNEVFSCGIPIPKPLSLASVEERLEGQRKETFLRMMDSMLQWDPAKRQTAAELVKADWIRGESGE